MHKSTDARSATAGLAVGITFSAAESGMAKLTPLHREIVSALPKGDRQEIRVLFAALSPGDRTPYHSHRFPVTVFVTEGVFTLELDGREAVEIAAGTVFVEPPQIRMTGRNRGEVPAQMVLFYVCDPDTPFADPADE